MQTLPDFDCWFAENFALKLSSSFSTLHFVVHNVYSAYQSWLRPPYSGITMARNHVHLTLWWCGHLSSGDVDQVILNTVILYGILHIHIVNTRSVLMCRFVFILLQTNIQHHRLQMDRSCLMFASTDPLSQPNTHTAVWTLDKSNLMEECSSSQGD